MSSSITLHATSVVFCGRGLLLRGPSGAGKSDLALRLIDAGGTLIADDYTNVHVHENHLIASSPDTIKGMMEVRGVGLLAMPYLIKARLDLVVDCESHERIERLPAVIHTEIHSEIQGIRLRLLTLYPFESSAVAKLRALLQNKLTNE
ncbi:MAG: serine/threonine protein kinase [Alphaproteobacteria bacterium]|nr:serine/threonine protein kinase [Alphaproteobacteria bacterium]